MPVYAVSSPVSLWPGAAFQHQPFPDHATRLASGPVAGPLQLPHQAAVNDPLTTSAHAAGHLQPQLATAWWQAVRQAERTLAAAGPQNHADLERLEHWVLNGDSGAALVALATLRRLQPLYRRSAEGRAWAQALHQAQKAWSVIPPAVAGDAGHLEAYLRSHPHLALALQQPRLVRQAQASVPRLEQRGVDDAGLPGLGGRSDKMRLYTHADARSGLPLLRKSSGAKHTLGSAVSGRGSPCYREISHRHTHGQWRAHHVTLEGDCNMDGTPSCGQAYGIDLAQRLAERPAIVRALPGQIGLPPMGHGPHAIERGELAAWWQRHGAPQVAAAPTAARVVIAARGDAVEPPIPADTPTVIERHAQDLLQTLSTIIQNHARPWLQADPSRPLQDFLPPELSDHYVELMDHMRAYTEKANPSDKRQRIDIYADPKLAEGLERWAASVCDWLQLAPDTDARYELEGVANLYFVAHADRLNALSLRADIHEMQSSSEVRLLHDTVRDLTERYGISPVRAGELVKEIDTIDYTMRELLRTIREVGKLGNLREQKARMLGVLCGLIIQGSLRGVAPMAYQNVNQNNSFHLMAYYEYYGAIMLANLVNAQASSDMEKALIGMESWINYQLLYCVFYGEPPKDDFNSLYNALLRGREAGGQLIGGGLTGGLPDLSMLIGSTITMTAFDYRLGLLNVMFLPLTFAWARHQNLKVQSLHKQGVAEIDRSARAILSLIDAASDLRTLTGLPKGFEDTIEQLKLERRLVRTKGVKQIWASALTLLPMQIAGLMSVTAGVQIGLSFGQVLASAIAAVGMHAPLQRLIKLVFTTAPPLVLDVKGMQAKLTRLDEFDLPGGAMDEARRPVSTLPDLRVTFEDVHFAVPKRGGTAEQVLTEPPIKVILRGANLTVEPGEMICLVGASGSGKTTLIKLLAGVHQPTAGRVCIGGVPREAIRRYGDDSILSTIHYTTQHPKFFPSMTVMENLTFGLPEAFDNEEDTAKAHAIVEALLERLHFAPDFDLHAPYSPILSGGEHARLGVIRGVLPILMGGSGILLADEPTAPLDPKSQENDTPGCAEAVIELLQEVASMGVPVICVSHDPKLVAVARTVKMSDINPDAEPAAPPCN
jgi:ABC-type lipoprotein export system ATPase subunit